MVRHVDIWNAIDAVAARAGLSTSGLAKAAGLDPTTFNRSKRTGADGRPRWPSTESIASLLEAAGMGFDEFGAMAAGGGGGRSIPIVGLAKAGADGFFDEQGFPASTDETLRFPDLGDARVYALEISGDSMLPTYRAGDVVIVQPGAALRRGDRVVVRLASGEVMAKELGRRNDQWVELVSLNPAYPIRRVAAAEIAWIARILWASQ